MFTLLSSSSNNKFPIREFPPEDAKRAVLRKLGLTKNNPEDFININTRKWIPEVLYYLQYVNMLG